MDMNESVPHVWLPSCAQILSQGWVLRKLRKCSRRMTTPHAVIIVDIGRDEPAFCTCSGKIGCRGEMGLASLYAAQRRRTAESILILGMLLSAVAARTADLCQHGTPTIIRCRVVGRCVRPSRYLRAPSRETGKQQRASGWKREVRGLRLFARSPRAGRQGANSWVSATQHGAKCGVQFAARSGGGGEATGPGAERLSRCSASPSGQCGVWGVPACLWGRQRRRETLREKTGVPCLDAVRQTRSRIGCEGGCYPNKEDMY